MSNWSGGLSGAASGAAAGSMFGPWGAAIGGVGGGLLGLFSDDGSGGLSREAREILARMDAEAGGSAYSGLEEDPELRGKQMETLAALKEIADAKGMDTQAKVANRQALDEANANARGQRGAIMQHYGARGMGGSGTELAAQLSSAQSAANANSRFAAQTASDANRRALSALGQYGNMAGSVRGQDWDVASTKASAADAMARFNAGQRVAKAGMQSGVDVKQGQNQWLSQQADIEALKNTAAAAYGKWGRDRKPTTVDRSAWI